MGTRSMSFVIDEYDNKTPLIQLYRQYDGYPEGMGQDVYNFLANRYVTNEQGEKSHATDNGMDDLAAQFVSFIKGTYQWGNVYVYPIRKLPTKKQTFEEYRDKYLLKYAKDCGCEYVYIIHRIEGGGIEVQVWDIWEKKLIFAGKPEGLRDAFNLKTEEILVA